MIKIANIGIPKVNVSNEGVTISTSSTTGPIDPRYIANGGFTYNATPNGIVDTKSIVASEINACRIHSPFRLLPDVEKVIFNPPATVVMWADGSKTVVKTHGEKFSEEHGLAMAIARKYFGGSRNAFQRACKTASTPSSEEEK